MHTVAVLSPEGAVGLELAGACQVFATAADPETGFGTAVLLRQHFAKAFATTPTAYRRTFKGNSPHR
ncbi:hypothetical protein [Kribbella sandramycini]|uniref:Transcriptional regulator GlxA family with amidase domain n=1 Tax=Kribbella sandramycini TaxID=60450 RepID=A0A841S229_9ACTN|nr:hypothetical protein [Kribbella sandramycini]MBB6564867.1 transcriptional regulator GlxA family with amidase domain [Kribbella sandramycini]